MKRRIGLLVATVLVAGVGTFTPSPASAHTTVCAGAGTATLATGFGLPGVSNTHTVFNFTFGGLAACVDGSALTATGHVHGACGLSSGEGITNTGHVFAFASQGGVMVVTGMVNGTASVTADVFEAGSCLNGTANKFNIAVSAALTHPDVSCTQALTNYPTNNLLLVHAWACDPAGGLT